MVVELPAFETCVVFIGLIGMYFAIEKHGYEMGYKAARRRFYRQHEAA